MAASTPLDGETGDFIGARSSVIRLFQGRRTICVVRRRVTRGWLMMWSASFHALSNPGARPVAQIWICHDVPWLAPPGAKFAVQASGMRFG